MFAVPSGRFRVVSILPILVFTEHHDFKSGCTKVAYFKKYIY